MFSERSHFERTEEPLDRELAKCDFLSLNDKADILLMAEGRKKASIISMIGIWEDPAAWERFERNEAHLQRVLNGAHLPYDLFRERDGRFVLVNFEVGSDATAMEELRAVRNIEEGPERAVAMGKLFGFPDTAIRGYLEERKKDNKDLPEEVRASAAMPFLNFRLSEDHWRDEWKSVEERAAAVRSLAPETYRLSLREGEDASGMSSGK